MNKLKWVPLPVLEMALINKKHREIALFLFLKLTSNDRFYIRGRKRREVMQVLQLSEDSLERRLNCLLHMNWLGRDPKTGQWFIRGFQYINLREQFKSSTAVYLQVQDVFHLQAFSFAACVGFLVRTQRKKDRRGAECKLWRSYQSPANIFKPVALSAMKKIFGLSDDTLIKLKKEAIRLGYLFRDRSYIVLTNYTIDKHHPEYYVTNPEHWGRVRRKGNQLLLTGPDLFSDTLVYTTKKWRK